MIYVTSYRKNWNFNFITKSRLMRVLNFNLENKTLSRNGGVVITSTTCFLIGGLWLLWGVFHQPIVEFVLSNTTPAVIVSSVVTKPLIFTEVKTVLNLFEWKGDKFKSGHLFWQNYITKKDLLFAFKCFIPHLQLVPTNTRLSVLSYMYDGSTNNLLLLSEMSTRGILNSYWFNLDNAFSQLDSWPYYPREFPKSLITFIMVWKDLIVKI